MTHDRKTLEQIEQITDRAGDALSANHARRLADLRHILAAGGTLTTAERAEVSELWNRYVRFTQPAQGGDHGNADNDRQQDETEIPTDAGERHDGEVEAAA